MTYYIQYGSQRLTCHWHTQHTTLVVRLSTPAQSLIIRMGDTLLITNKRGDPVWSCRVAVFTPRMRYGGFTRSGIVECDGVADLRDEARFNYRLKQRVNSHEQSDNVAYKYAHTANNGFSN